jgi:proline iminopeptidase
MYERSCIVVDVPASHMREQTLTVPGGRVWSGRYGEGPGLPLLVLHGGPGMPSYYLAGLTELADTRTVVLYDQLGCGRSERPRDPSLWTLNRAIAEVEAVRQALGLRRFHLLGHSWGGFLALAYSVQHGRRLASLVLSSPLVSVADWTNDAIELLSTLSPTDQATIKHHEARGTVDDPEYVDATMNFYKRYFCRLEPWPEALQKTFDEMGMDPYRHMWGPSEFTQTGNLRGQDLSPALETLAMPSLWTCGTDDEATPWTTRRSAELASGRLRIFEDGTHCVHLEQPTEYLRTVGGFLLEMDTDR